MLPDILEDLVVKEAVKITKYWFLILNLFK